MSTIKDKYSKLLKDKKDNLANVKKTNTSNKVSTVSKKEIVDTSIPEITIKDKSRKATLDGKKIIIKFNYDAELVAQIKNLDGRKYILDGKYWTCTCTLNNINSLVTLNFNLDSKLKIKHEQLIKIVTKRNTPKKYNTDNIKVPKGLSLMEFQKEGVGFIESRNGNVIVGDEMGTGKAQSLDSKILTPKGWIRMGDIKINDTVIDSNGKLTKVIGVYPQGKKSVYKVTFSDGSSTECCDEHLWCLTTTNSRKRKPNSVSIKQLSEFKDDLFKYDKNNKITGRKWFIPIVKPIDFENNVDLLIHPYLLGIILSEGGISTKAIHITTSEENIINYCETLLPETLLINKIKNTKYDYRIVQKDINKNCNILTRNLRHYNLMGTNSHTKFIPEDYLFSSIENRILLLQGLMDGDGCGNTLNSCGYVTASNALYLGIKFLIESLGGVLNNPKQVYKKIKDKTYGPFWYFSFRLPKDIKPFLNSNKKNIYSSQHKYVPYRAFDKVEYIGEKECQCICVDSPTHMYLTDDCIVTHNTITVLTYISNHPELTPVVIVVPATLKYNWKKEADKWLLTKRDIQILESKKTKKLKKSSDIIIVNYDIVHAWRKEIANINPKVLVLDECHAIKTSTTKRTKGVKHIAKKAKHIIPMSGTPAINRPAELYNSIKLVEPELFGSFQSYAQRYCDAYFNGYGWEYKGGSNLEELYDILSNIMIRRKKEDVIEDLPEKRRTFVSLDLTNISDYNKAENDFIEWVRENKGKRAADRASSAEKLVKVGTLRLLAVRGALANSIQWIKNFLADYDGKLVVFAVHKEIISALMEEFGDIAVKIDGSVPTGEVRQTIVEKFQNDKNIRLFVGNIKAAGVGITLTASSNIVFLELPWTPGELEQAEDRCLIKGQKVMTPKGYISIEKLKIGDYVFGGKGNICKITDKWSSQVKQDLVSIKVYGYQNEIICTKNHKFLVEDKWVEAGLLSKGDRLNFIPTQKKKIIDYIEFPNKYRVNDIFINNYGAEQTNGRLKHIPNKIKLDSNFLFTCGYYIGDGYTGKNAHGISFSGNNYSKVQSLKICEEWLRSINLNSNYYKSKKSKSLDLTCYNKELRLWFLDMFGNNSHNKKIPEWMYLLSEEQCKEVIKGLMSSDGYIRRNQGSYATVSEKLVAQVCWLFTRAGYKPTIEYKKSAKCYYINYTINENSKYPIRTNTIKEIKIIPNKDKRTTVYDITVENDESFIVGNSILHNCHRMGQKNAVNIWYLLAENTIEMELAKMIDSKRNILSQVLDGQVISEEDTLSSLLGLYEEKG